MHRLVRPVYAALGAYGTMAVIGICVLGLAALLAVALIPVYIGNKSDDVLGEYYCIRNHTLRVGLQIPEYNVTFTDSIASRSYNFSVITDVLVPTPISVCNSSICRTSITEEIAVADTCTYATTSIISPAVPNAKVFNSYALGQACYRTLQSCSYDPLLTACLLSDCTLVSVFNSTANASTPLTYYTLTCAATVYYSTRCTDAAANDRLYYTASQKNSVCRQRRLDRINTCLNSTMSLSSVPCLVSVSSGLVTTTAGSCIQTATSSGVRLTVTDNIANVPVARTFPWGVTPAANNSRADFQTSAFAVSDQNNGHVYRVDSVTSEIYNTSQVGARYCGSITSDQINAAINTAISSQNSG